MGFKPSTFCIGRRRTKAARGGYFGCLKPNKADGSPPMSVGAKGAAFAPIRPYFGSGNEEADPLGTKRIEIAREPMSSLCCASHASIATV